MSVGCDKCGERASKGYEIMHKKGCPNEDYRYHYYLMWKEGCVCNVGECVQIRVSDLNNILKELVILRKELLEAKKDE